jgi:hypothetical protein
VTVAQALGKRHCRTRVEGGRNDEFVTGEAGDLTGFPAPSGGSPRTGTRHQPDGPSIIDGMKVDADQQDPNRLRGILSISKIAFEQGDAATGYWLRLAARQPAWPRRR